MTLPVVSSVLNVRSLLMASDGSISETAISRRTASVQSAHVRRVDGETAMVWCAGNSRTYIVIKLAHMIAGESVPSTINIAHGIISNYIRVAGDGPIANGRYNMVGLGGVQVMAWNADNHQLTWGVLSAALAAVLDFMRVFGNGAATFNILDGAHMVGQGTVQKLR